MCLSTSPAINFGTKLRPKRWVTAEDVRNLERRATNDASSSLADVAFADACCLQSPASAGGLSRSWLQPYNRVQRLLPRHLLLAHFANENSCGFLGKKTASLARSVNRLFFGCCSGPAWAVRAWTPNIWTMLTSFPARSS